MKHYPLSLLSLAALLTQSSFAMSDEQLVQLEKFVFSPNKAEILKALPPATPWYYYLNALNAQHEGNREQYQALVSQFATRFPQDPMLKRLQLRQALLDWEGERKAESAKFLKGFFPGVSFSYPRPPRANSEVAQFPSQVPREVTDPLAILKNHLPKAGGVDGSAGNLSRSALIALYQNQLGLDLAPVSNQIFSQVEWMPGTRWVDFLVRTASTVRGLNLDDKIYPLTLDQLEHLRNIQPGIEASSGMFAELLFWKMIPADSALWPEQPEKELAWLESQLPWVQKLPATRNALKSAVLQRMLGLQIRCGKISRETFLAYLSIPRYSFWISPAIIRNAQNSPNLASTIVPPAFDQQTPLGRICPDPDDRVVRYLLVHFLAGAESTAEFDRLVNPAIVRETWAMANLLRGKGDTARWTEILGASRVTALTAETFIRLRPQTQSRWPLADAPQLDFHLKNTPRLTVRTYAINMEDAYRNGMTFRDEGVGKIDLSGFVPTTEKVYEFNQAPVLVHDFQLKFPELAGKRGCWVVDIIANGVSSRAIINKGRFEVLSRPVDTGVVMSVLDEDLKPVAGAVLDYAGRKFTADARGQVLVPWVKDGGEVEALVKAPDSGFVMPVQVNAGFVNRKLELGVMFPESACQPGATVPLVLSPQIRVNGAPSLMAPARPLDVTVEVFTLDGARSSFTRRIEPAAFGKTLEINVPLPKNYSGLRVSGVIYVDSIKPGEEPEMLTSGFSTLNAGRSAENLAGLEPYGCLLVKNGNNWALEVRDRAGNLQPNRVVSLSVYLPFGLAPSEGTFATGADGRVQLGELSPLSSIRASLGESWQGMWSIGEMERRGATSAIQVIPAGKKSVIPFNRTADVISSSVALVETGNDGGYRRLVGEYKMENGGIELPGLPEGTYTMLLDGQPWINLAVASQILPDGWGRIASARKLIRGEMPAVGLGDWKIEGDKAVLQTWNAQPGTPVAVSAGGFAGRELSAGGGAVYRPGGEMDLEIPESRYFEGGVLAEDVRYVLDRQYAKAFPGVMLPQPGVLLDPWKMMETRTVYRRGREGRSLEAMPPEIPAPRAARMTDPFAGSAPVAPAPSLSPESMDMSDKPFGGNSATGALALPAASMRGRGGVGSFSQNFLSRAPGVWVLQTDDQGRIALPLDQLKGYSWLTATHVSPRDNLSVSIGSAISTADAPAIRDAVQPDVPQSKPQGAEFQVVSGIGKPAGGEGIQALALTSVPELYQALMSVCQDASRLGEFSFLSRWSGLKPGEKRDFVKRYASHELNLFIWNHDRAFFDAEIKPVLANKRIKQLVDDIVLGNKLDSWLDAGRFSRLNAVERALLGRFASAENRKEIVRLLEQAAQANPVDPEIYLSRMQSVLGIEALRSNALKDKVGGDVGRQYDSMKSGGGSRGMNKGFAARNGAAQAADGVIAGGETATYGYDGKAEATQDLEELISKSKEEAGFFIPPGQPWQLAESQWYRLPLASQTEALFRESPVWAQLANTTSGKYLPERFLEVADDWRASLAILALADLPLQADPAAGAEVPFLRVEASYKPMAEAPAEDRVQLNRHFVLPDPRTSFENYTAVQPDSFEAGTVYSMVLALGNPSGKSKAVTLQSVIPSGAIAVYQSPVASPMPRGGQGGGPEVLPPGNSATTTLQLQPYSYRNYQVFFMFPKPGDFVAQPVSATANRQIVGSLPALPVKVQPASSVQNPGSWSWVAAQGTTEQVLEFLATANPAKTPLEPMLWRLSDAGVYRKVSALLSRRFWIDPRVQAFALVHQDSPVLAQWLVAKPEISRTAGPLSTTWIQLQPEQDFAFEVFDYAPYINNRILPLSGKVEIPNARFRAEYEEFLELSALDAKPGAERWIVLSTYLILQDRIPEAIDMFSRIKREEVAEKLQYDYLAGWLALARGDVAAAEEIAKPHAGCPNARWQKLFSTMLAQIAEARTGKPAGGNDPFARMTDTQLNVSLSAQVWNNEIQLTSRGTESVNLRWFPMNAELMFTQSPFLSADSDTTFSLVEPASSGTVKLNENGLTNIPMPRALAGKNVLVEISSGDTKTCVTIFPNSFDLAIARNAGQLMVREIKSSKPLAKAYVKAYARLKSGEVVFYKDGYTDLRGRFDYASLNDNQINNVDEFSLLVITPDNGSVIRQVAPPAR